MYSSWHIKLWTLVGALLGFVVIAAVDEFAKNAHIIEERASIEELEKIQREASPRKESVEGKLKEAVVNYKTPDKKIGGVKFKLSSIHFSPESQLISKVRLKELSNKYLNSQITFDDLQHLRIDIINEYQKMGYTLSSVNLPAQKLTNNKLTIQLIESKIKNIEFTGNEYLPKNYFDRIIGNYREKHFNVRNLELDLLRFNRSSKASMMAKSKASETFGYSDLVFQVYEPERVSMSVSFDNSGVERLGKWKYLSSISIYDVTNGVDDNLVVGTTQSKGANSWYGVYDRPLNSFGTRANVSVTKGETRVSAGAGSDLGILGSSESISFELSHLLYISRTTAISSRFGLRHSSSESFFVGSSLDDSTIQSAFLILIADRTDELGTWNTELGVVSGDATRFDEDAQKFTTFNFFVKRIQKLHPNVSASLSFNGQLSNELNLPSAQSFSVGGQSSVRGYEDSAILGDKGYSTRLEVTTALFRWLDLPQTNTLNSIQLTFFRDYGVAYTNKGGGIGIDSDALNSYGVVAYYQPVQEFFLSVGYAHPMNINEELYNKRNWSCSVRYSINF